MNEKNQEFIKDPFYHEDESDHLPDSEFDHLSDFEVIAEIKKLKDELKDELIILGHHYQSDDIIQFADYTGDSLKLAQISAQLDKPYIIFCGVHFMAETADILAQEHQKVILPDLNAGCTMADMAKLNDVEKAWDIITKLNPQNKIIPITYINCDANLKSFVGKNHGSICTSSNAQKVIEWAFEQGDKLFFFPDQHLGRNTCYRMGIPQSQMKVYNPKLPNGGLSEEEIKNAKVFLWYGLCSVHQGFNLGHIEKIRKDEPNTKIIVHPECNFDVVNHADDAGSTAYIINKIKAAKPGESFAIATEINLVTRLKNEHPHLKIKSLSPYQCLCTTMYRIRPRWLLSSINSIKNGKAINIIEVKEDDIKYSKIALNQMLKISL